MRTRHLGFPLASAAVLLAAASAPAVEVKLTVSDGAKVARKAGTVTCGVPFARGALKDVKRLSASVGGKKAVPAQFIKLASWDDGSVRWALMDVQVDVPAGGKTGLVVRDDGRNRAPAKPVKVTDAAGEVRVSTGPLELVLDKQKPGLFKSLKVNGKELVSSAGKGLVLYTHEKHPKAAKDKRGRTILAPPPTTPGDPLPAAAPDEVKVEQAGPMRAVVMLRGKFPSVHGGLMGYTARLTAFAGRKFVKLHVWLENRGQHGYTTRNNKPAYKPEWYAFDGMAVELGLSGLSSAACEGVESGGKFKVFQRCKPPAPRAPWRTPAYTWNDFEYRITGGGKELKKGARTDGVVALSGGGAKLTAAVRHFWQNYEKAIELDQSTLKIWLWPLEGQYPRSFNGHAGPGYATKMIQPLRRPGLYNMPGSVYKGHEMVLDFSGRDPKESSAELSEPLFALAPAQYYAATEAAPGLFAPPEVRTAEAECNGKLDAWMRLTMSAADPESKSSIWHARRDTLKRQYGAGKGMWYGWMDFGDLAMPGAGAVSVHYDWPWIMCVNFMRTGDPNFLRLGTEMMRHRVDVDQQWSDRALEGYRGFQRVGYTYTHFHTSRFTRGQPNVDSNWLAGVVLYYMLTGDLRTLECIGRASAALGPAWERMGKSRDYGTRVKQGDMQMAARSIFSCCAMYALTAEKKWLDLAMKIFNTRVMAKYKSHGPHMHARQQIRSQDYTKDDIKYCYSIQAFCLLQHYTGDKKVLEVLKAGCDKDFPENFFDAPLFLADLHAYVALKTGKTDYVDDAVEHWIEASSESKCPPLYMPGNSQWSKAGAMHMRTGHLLQYYFWKKGKK